MRTYTADTAATRINNYGFDTDLTRTFEYCDKASNADDTHLAPVELLIEILIRNDHARIDNGTLHVANLDNLPIGSRIIRTQQLIDTLQEASDRGELHAWIVNGLERLRIVDAWMAMIHDQS